MPADGAALTFLDAVALARAALRAGDAEEAELRARAALAADPMRADGYNVLALALELQGFRARAADLLRAALAVEPTHRAAWANLERLTSSPVLQPPIYGDEEPR